MTATVWALLLIAQRSPGRPAFAVASVKVSEHIVGKDYGNRVAISPAGLSARNTSLKRLIVEGYNVQPFQVTGGPNWLDTNEYEVEARAGGVVSPDQVRAMLRSLLAERFGLAIHPESKELRVYELTVDPSGPRLRSSEDGLSMRQFCDLLGVKLSIHLMDDPTKPGMASGPPVPVVDRTGLSGLYEIPVEIKLEPGADMVTLWQRALRDVGLKLASRKASVEILSVEHAEKIPLPN